MTEALYSSWASQWFMSSLFRCHRTATLSKPRIWHSARTVTIEWSVAWLCPTNWSWTVPTSIESTISTRWFKHQMGPRRQKIELCRRSVLFTWVFPLEKTSSWCIWWTTMWLPRLTSLFSVKSESKSTSNTLRPARSQRTLYLITIIPHQLGISYYK